MFPHSNSVVRGPLQRSLRLSVLAAAMVGASLGIDRTTASAQQPQLVTGRPEPAVPLQRDDEIRRLAAVGAVDEQQPDTWNGQHPTISLRTRLVSHEEFVQGDAEVPQPISDVDAPLVAPGDPARCTPRCDNCNTLGPFVPCPVRGFHCVGCPDCQRRHKKDHYLYDSVAWQAFGPGQWQGAGPIPWEAFGHGEYIGPPRTAHVPEYRLRVDDLMDFVFRLTREATAEAYRLEVGDQIRVESLTAAELDRDAMVQPDGSITLRLLGQVPAYGMTLSELREDLERRYEEQVQNPTITVSPIEINTRLEELRATVDNRFGRGGQSIGVRITPEGTLQLPAIGSVYAQGLTIEELKQDIDARYRRLVQGLEVTPILQQRAPRFVYVVGEVAVPGRYTLEAPTSVMQAIALAGGWNVGGNLNHIVVFRRDENWNLMATKLDVFGALYGKEPCPADEIWLRDSDIVLVPKRAVLVADDVIELLFTRGLYGVVPLNVGLNFAKLSTL